MRLRAPHKLTFAVDKEWEDEDEGEGKRQLFAKGKLHQPTDKRYRVATSSPTFLLIAQKEQVTTPREVSILLRMHQYRQLTKFLVAPRFVRRVAPLVFAGSGIPRENVFVDVWRGGEGWRGKGWVIAQSRFLASIVTQPIGDDSWLFLFDDDAFVNAPEIDKLISSVNSKESAIYGQMQCAKACGGAGILFSPSMLKALREVSSYNQPLCDTVMRSLSRFARLRSSTPNTTRLKRYAQKTQALLVGLPPKMAYDKHLTDVIRRYKIGALMHDNR